MGIDLLALEPHKVSRDLSGYVTFIYGAPKTGKTTLASQMPNSLLLAFERGYNALPGIIAQDITSWTDMKTIYRELKKPEVQARFKCLIVDTVDIASDLCQKWICNQLGIENIGDGGWSTNGWAKFKKEFEETFRGLTQMGYAVFFISHAKETTEKDEQGNDRMLIRPSLSTAARGIIENMADIYGYAHPVRRDGKTTVKLTLRDPDGTITCGGRFKYIAPEIDFNYDALVSALSEAVDKEAAEHDNKFVTNDRELAPIEKTYDYDALMKEFSDNIGVLMAKNPEYYQPRITQIIDKYLGKGKKISEATRDQAEFISLIVDEINETLMKDVAK